MRQRVIQMDGEADGQRDGETKATRDKVNDSIFDLSSSSADAA